MVFSPNKMIATKFIRKTRNSASLTSTNSVMSTLYTLVLGVFFLAGVEKCIATIDSTDNSLDTDTNTTRIRTRKHDGRILESIDASPGEFPFFSQWGGCGATLIWEDILLTSGSCDAVKSRSVIVGAHVSNQQQGDSVRRNIVSRHRHPEFNRETQENNFMLLKLDKKVDGLPNVWIDPTAEILSNAELYVVGFGYTASLMQVHHIYSRTFHHTILDNSNLLQRGNGPLTSELSGSVLQKAKMSLVSHAVCNAYDQYAGFIDKENMICASDDDRTCLGDNGGPLCMMVNNECLQIGIVSFGDMCALGHRPTVYSSIAAVYGWIEKNICSISDNPPPNCQASVASGDPIKGRTARKNKNGPKNGVKNGVLILPDDPPSPPSNEPPIPSNDREGFFILPDDPSLLPSNEPSLTYSTVPSKGPLLARSNKPSVTFSSVPSDGSSFAPSDTPSIVNSALPSAGPSLAPSDNPSILNSAAPSDEPSLVLTRSEGKYRVDSSGQNARNLEEFDFDNVDFENLRMGIFRLPIEPEARGDSDSSVYSKPFVTESPESSVTASNSFRTDNSESTPRLSSSTKLGECEGDCDSDEDCDEGLYCYMKDRWVGSVPGCKGFDESRTDYCIRITPTSPKFPQPLPVLLVFDDNPPDISNYPLQLCQGDCDRDSDCADGLVCYSRNFYEASIPGCYGRSTSRTDFCVDPSWSDSPSASPSRWISPWSDNLNQTMAPSRRVTPEPKFSFENIPSPVPSRRPTFDPTSSPIIARSSAPSNRPTKATANSKFPTPRPTQMPTNLPTLFPTKPRTIPPTKSQISSRAEPEPLPPAQSSTPTPGRQPSNRPPIPPPTEEQTLPTANSPTIAPKRPPEKRLTNPTSSPLKGQTQPPAQPSTPAPMQPAPKRTTIFPATPSPTKSKIPATPSPTKPRTPATSSPMKSRTPATPSPTKSNTRPPTARPTPLLYKSLTPSSVSITFAIYFDPWPEEIAWKIESGKSEKVVASVSTGTYSPPLDHALELISLTPGENYALTITDSSGDGIAGIGTLYEVYMTDRPEIVLLNGNGVFESGRSGVFYVPASEEYPSSAPTEPTISPAPTLKTVTVYLVIVFDTWHQETGWVLTDESDKSIVLAEASYNTYRFGESVTEEISLPAGGTYTFTIKDFFNDGIADGKYFIMNADGDIIFEGDGGFASSRSHTFRLPD